MKLKRIGVLSLAKLQAIIMGFFGLIMGLVIFVITGIFNDNPETNDILISGLGVFSIVITPIGYSIMGFIVGAVSALLYNLVAKWIGGVELEFGE